MYLIEKNAPSYMTGLIRTKKKEYTDGNAPCMTRTSPSSFSSSFLWKN